MDRGLQDLAVYRRPLYLAVVTGYGATSIEHRGEEDTLDYALVYQAEAYNDIPPHTVSL